MQDDSVHLVPINGTMVMRSSLRHLDEASAADTAASASSKKEASKGGGVGGVGAGGMDGDGSSDIGKSQVFVTHMKPETN